MKEHGGELGAIAHELFEVMRKCGDEVLEIVHDGCPVAWTKAYVHLKSFDGKARFSTWLTRIAINTVLMTLRQKRVRPETSTESTDGETWHQLEIADQTKVIEQQYLRHESLENLRRAVCGLRPTLRQVIEIHQLNDTSIEQVAKLAGISITATKSRLLRERAILRRALDPQKNGAMPHRPEIFTEPALGSLAK